MAVKVEASENDTDASELLAEFMEDILIELIEQPECLKVSHAVMKDSVQLQIEAADSDIKYILGAEKRTFYALCRIVNSAARRHRVHLWIDPFVRSAEGTKGLREPEITRRPSGFRNRDYDE